MTRPRTGQRNPPAAFVESVGVSILAAGGSAAPSGAPASAVATRCGGCECAGAAAGTRAFADAAGEGAGGPAATRVDFAAGIVSCWPTLSLASGARSLTLAIADRD